jgi:hypothetical protein
MKFQMLILVLFESLTNFSCTWDIIKDLYKRLDFSSSELSPRLFDISGFVPRVVDTQSLVLLYPELKKTNPTHVALFADFLALNFH